jgi:hypothetical protein
VLGMAAGCVDATGSEGSDDPLTSPAFLTPVSQAQESGVKLYWMGTEFQAGPLLFQVRPVADLSPTGTGLSLDYIGDVGGGYVVTGLEVYTEDGGGSEELRRRASAVRGASVENVNVGAWKGELFLLPSGNARPVNQRWLFVDLGEVVAVVQAASGTTGVPATDANPLIEKDLLIQVVAENLRPYPQ